MIEKMKDWLNKYRSNAKIAQHLPGGMHVLQSSSDPPYRLHLRIEGDGRGLLIINAATILHLNTTAAEYVYHLVHETPEDEIVAEISTRYRVKKKTILSDLSELSKLIDQLIIAPNSNFESILDLEQQLPSAADLSAPYRLDCAVTEIGANSESKQMSASVLRELTTAEWGTILDKAWEAGIPHILFVGGEPTEREDLAALIRRCQENGQVAGLVTDGKKLANTNYLYELLQAGLDHVVIVIDQTPNWGAIASLSYWSEMLEENIVGAVHFTLTADNAEDIETALDQVRQYGIKSISLTAEHQSLTEQLLNLRDSVDHLLLNLVWDLPVPFARNDPITLELARSGEKIPERTAGAIHIGPNGEVKLSRDESDTFGNVLTDSWESIWEKISASQSRSL
jgi:organic radical activating enzyme